MSSEKTEQRRRLVVQMERQLGRALVDRLNDPAITDILLNADGVVYEDRLGVGLAPIGTMAPDMALMFINTVASMAGETIDQANPILECELWTGARFEAVSRPVTPAPIFAIRLHARQIYTLNDYVSDVIMTEGQAAILRKAVRARQNIVISGGTRSGKTTLGNAIAQEAAAAAPDDRIVILEDTVELQCPNHNAVALRTTKTVAMRDLVRACMRLRPDRIVIGEVRGGEALDLLKAWNTGHEGGFCTIHANTAASTPARLEQLIAEVTQMPAKQLISEAVDLIVSIAREGTGRRVREIVRVCGFDKSGYQLETLGE